MEADIVLLKKRGSGAIFSKRQLLMITAKASLMTIGDEQLEKAVF
jgi:hypothetical protein